MTASPRFPVSIKGVVLGGCPPWPRPRVALLQNERAEWELPGGKLEAGESPEACLVREVREELGVAVTAGPVLDVWVYVITPGTEVLVVTYGCHAEPFEEIRWSAEHRAGALVELDALAALPMPEAYRRSIRTWAPRMSSASRRGGAVGPCSRERGTST